MADRLDDIRTEAEKWARSSWDPNLSVGEWWALLAEERYALPSLPESAYGRGYSRAEENATRQGLADAGTLGPPGGISTMMAAPTIAQHGTRTQIDRYVPRIIDGTEAWCQLFSEPGAGSDLAGLKTKAVRDGDEWIVSGQKVWTSFAHEADLGMLLARTDPDAPKHGGISWFSFPMQQSSVDIRPLTEMTGRAMFNEVFIDAGVVADDAMIGKPGEGWAVGNTTLLFERSALAGSGVSLPYARTGRRNGDLDKRAGDFGDRADGPASKVPAGMPFAVWYGQVARDLGRNNSVVRQELARHHILTEVNRLNGLRARTGALPSIGNLGKLAMSEIARSQREVANLVIGAAGMLAGTDADAGPAHGDVQRQTLSSPAPAIYGGTDEVQRNIIGERVLGLPKEPGPHKSTPFRDLPQN